jgi:hypothetical protein
VFRSRFYWLAAAAFTLSACAQDERSRNPFEIDILTETFGYGPDTPSNVDVEQLYQGCSRRDCIPSIDEPQYVPASEANFLSDSDLILGLNIAGDQRAFPIRILDYHEIVNDAIGGQAVIVTWCPLCGSGLAFEPRVKGEIVEFGVSGLLHDSDLVMYDRKTESLWQQITGEAIMGDQLGQTLTQVPSTMTDWKTWRTSHPDTHVLSPQTGFQRDYFGRTAYSGYKESDELMFPASRRDFSVHPKTVVFGFELNGVSLAVEEATLEQQRQISFQHQDRSWTIRRAEDGTVTATDARGRSHTAIRLFWFAWYNFHPGTQRL